MVSRKAEILVVSVMAIAAVVTVTTVGFILSPYTPLTYHSVQTEPSQVCSGGTVRAYVDYEIKQEQYDSVHRLEVDSNWEAVDVPGVAAGTMRLAGEVTLEREMLSPGRREGESRIIRSAPDEPGEWRLKIESKLRGKNFGIPTTQVVTTSADENTVVLPGDHPECEGV